MITRGRFAALIAFASVLLIAALIVLQRGTGRDRTANDQAVVPLAATSETTDTPEPLLTATAAAEPTSAGTRVVDGQENVHVEIDTSEPAPVAARLLNGASVTVDPSTLTTNSTLILTALPVPDPYLASSILVIAAIEAKLEGSQPSAVVIEFAAPEGAYILHQVNGLWIPIATTYDNGRVRAVVNELSVFAVVARIRDLAADALKSVQEAVSDVRDALTWTAAGLLPQPVKDLISIDPWSAGEYKSLTGSCFILAYTGWQALEAPLDDRRESARQRDQINSDSAVARLVDNAMARAKTGITDSVILRWYEFHSGITSAIRAARDGHRIVLVGHSAGGAAALTTARYLDSIGYPVSVLVEIDTYVGGIVDAPGVYFDNGSIPANVRVAVNRYQKEPKLENLNPYWGRPRVEVPGKVFDLQMPFPHGEIDDRVADGEDGNVAIDQIAKACAPVATASPSLTPAPTPAPTPAATATPTPTTPAPLLAQYAVYHVDAGSAATPSGDLQRCEFVFSRLPDGRLFEGIYYPKIGKGAKVTGYEAGVREFSLIFDDARLVSGTTPPTYECGGAEWTVTYLGTGERVLVDAMTAGPFYMPGDFLEILPQTPSPTPTPARTPTLTPTPPPTPTPPQETGPPLGFSDFCHGVAIRIDVWDYPPLLSTAASPATIDVSYIAPAGAAIAWLSVFIDIDGDSLSSATILAAFPEATIPAGRAIGPGVPLPPMLGDGLLTDGEIHSLTYAGTIPTESDYDRHYYGFQWSAFVDPPYVLEEPPNVYMNFELDGTSWTTSTRTPTQCY